MIFHGPQYRAPVADAALAARLRAASGFNLYGCPRLPRNVCRAGIGNAAQHDAIDRSISNFVDLLGKEVADSGHVMIMVEGWGASASPTEEDGDDRFQRYVVLLTGTCYNPRVSDWTLCKFDRVVDATSDVLELPCDVQIDEAPCRVTGEPLRIRSMTSSEVVSMITAQANLVRASLWEVEYTVLEPELGGLLNLRIDSRRLKGPLWQAGVEGPGILPPRKPGPSIRLRTGDPFDVAGRRRASATGRGRHGPRGRGLGRGGGGKAGIVMKRAR